MPIGIRKMDDGSIHIVLLFNKDENSENFQESTRYLIPRGEDRPFLPVLQPAGLVSLLRVHRSTVEGGRESRAGGLLGNDGSVFRRTWSNSRNHNP